MFKNKIEKYLRRAGYTNMKNHRTVDKPMVSLVCLGFLPWILLNVDMLRLLQLRDGCQQCYAHQRIPIRLAVREATTQLLLAVSRR